MATVSESRWQFGHYIIAIVSVPVILHVFNKIRNQKRKGRLVLLDIHQKFWHGSTNPPCCPRGSLPPSLSTTYKEQGKEVILDKLNGKKTGETVHVYVVGSATSKRCIIVFHDIFGWHSGRTREICDTLASAGYLVVLPDCFQGRAGRMSTMWIGILRYLSMVTNIRNSPWSRLREELELTIWPFLRDEQGIEVVGTLGFCYGGWCVAKANSASSHSSQCDGFGIAKENMEEKVEKLSSKALQVKCGVGLHASPGVVGWFHGEGDASSLFKSCQTPLMFLQAGNDPMECKQSGSVHEVLKSSPLESVRKGCHFKEFKDMSHGWTNRGDLSDPLVQRDYTEAFNLCVEFFERHLTISK